MGFWGVAQFGKEASQARDYGIAKNATLRAARPDPSLRKERLLRMTSLDPRRWAFLRGKIELGASCQITNN